MEGDVDIQTTGGLDWSCFAIPEETHDLESAPSSKTNRATDIDSLLMQDEG